MNTTQRVKETESYQMADVAWNDHRGPNYYDMPVPDFIRIYGPRPRLAAVIHRISRGWTSRDVLISRRADKDDDVIPF